MIEEIVKELIIGLVNNPEAVSITTKEDSKAIKLSIVVDDADIGRVIGKDGKMANALSTIVNAIAHKTTHKKYIIKINEGQR